jgi:hypothetical protein
MQNRPIMPARRVAIATAIALAAVLAAYLTAAARCPQGNARDAAACDIAHATGITALCVADAQKTETCADQATGIAHAADLARAASEWRKAAMAGARTTQSRRWLAHAMVLDERVQDDPTAPAALRAQAKRNEELARTALLRTR